MNQEDACMDGTYILQTALFNIYVDSKNMLATILSEQLESDGYNN